MPAIRKGYRRPGRVVLPRRLPVSPGRDGCHRGGQCPAKRWCARRTLNKNNRLRMFAGRVRRAHHGVERLGFSRDASGVRLCTLLLTH